MRLFFYAKLLTANSKQQTANSKQQTANSKQETGNSLDPQSEIRNSKFAIAL